MQAAILQRAVDYITDLHRQKAQLVAKNTRLIELLATGTGSSRPEVTSLPGAAKRRRLESLSSCSLSSDDGATDAPISGPRRRKPKVDRQEADRKLEDKVEDLRIPSLPLTTATLPVAAEAVIPEPSVRVIICIHLTGTYIVYNTTLTGVSFFVITISLTMCYSSKIEFCHIAYMIFFYEMT